jgi:glutaminyl-tRNA synthetase
MRFSFMTAKDNDGHCYLRYDDTNPEKENQEYIINIEKNVRWLGYEPYKITHASDYFEFIYEQAIKLIKKGLAFVDNLTKE